MFLILKLMLLILVVYVCKIWLFFRSEVVALIDLIIEYVNLSYLYLPQQILIHTTSQCTKSNQPAIFEHRLNSNNTLYGNMTRILNTKLLSQGPYSQSLTISNKKSTMAWPYKKRTILASIYVHIRQVSHDGDITILTVVYAESAGVTFICLNVHTRLNKYLLVYQLVVLARQLLSFLQICHRNFIIVDRTCGQRTQWWSYIDIGILTSCLLFNWKLISSENDVKYFLEA